MSLGQDSFLAELPDGWTFDRFKDIALLRNERTDEASEVEDYLELEDLESGTGRILNRRNTMDVVSDVTVFKKGDVLFGKLRPYLEKYYVAEFDGKCTGEILAFKPKRIESRFLFYCMASSWFIERCNMLAYGAKMPRVNWPTQLAQFNLPISPLSEQQRITAYLDASCKAIDAAVDAKRRQIETLNAINKAIITKAVTSGITTSVELRSSGVEWIGEIPSHWKVEKLKYLTSLIVDGTHITPTYLPDGVPFLRVTDIQDHTIDLGNVKYISPDEHQLLSKRARARRDDILLSKNGTIGVVKIVNWDWDFSFFVSICLLRPHKKLNPHYFSYFFESSLVDQQLSESSKKTSVTNLHIVKIRELLISLPPPDEQSKIVQYLQFKCAEVQSLKGNITNQITTLTAYHKSLIHECVTGQRRVTEEDVQRAAHINSIFTGEHKT